MEIYKAVAVRDWETHRVIFGAQGADLPNPFEDAGEIPKTAEDIRREALFGEDLDFEGQLDIGYEVMS
jgi:hypothetical protein